MAQQVGPTARSEGATPRHATATAPCRRCVERPLDRGRDEDNALVQPHGPRFQQDPRARAERPRVRMQGHHQQPSGHGCGARDGHDCPCHCLYCVVEHSNMERHDVKIASPRSKKGLVGEDG